MKVRAAGTLETWEAYIIDVNYKKYWRHRQMTSISIVSVNYLNTRTTWRKTLISGTLMMFSWINATPIKDSTLLSDTDNSRWGRNKTKFPSEETFLKIRLYRTLQMLGLTLAQLFSSSLLLDFSSIDEALLFQQELLPGGKVVLLSPFSESSIVARRDPNEYWRVAVRRRRPAPHLPHTAAAALQYTREELQFRTSAVVVRRTLGNIFRKLSLTSPWQYPIYF